MVAPRNRPARDDHPAPMLCTHGSKPAKPVRSAPGRRPDRPQPARLRRLEKSRHGMWRRPLRRSDVTRLRQPLRPRDTPPIGSHAISLSSRPCQHRSSLVGRESTADKQREEVVIPLCGVIPGPIIVPQMNGCAGQICDVWRCGQFQEAQPAAASEGRNSCGTSLAASLGRVEPRRRAKMSALDPRATAIGACLRPQLRADRQAKPGLLREGFSALYEAAIEHQNFCAARHR